MVENGYVITDEPTSEEFRTWQKVERHFVQAAIAAWMELKCEYGFERLTQEEFDLLYERFEKLDFSAEQEQALELEYQEIIEERGRTW